MSKANLRTVKCTVCHNTKVVSDYNGFLDSLITRGKIFCTKCFGLQSHVEIEKKRKVKV